MEAEDLSVNERSQGQEVEQVGEVFPDGCVTVLAEALVVEPVYLGDLTGFVVTAQDSYSLAVSNLSTKEHVQRKPYRLRGRPFRE